MKYTALPFFIGCAVTSAAMLSEVVNESFLSEILLILEKESIRLREHQLTFSHAIRLGQLKL